MNAILFAHKSSPKILRASIDSLTLALRSIVLGLGITVTQVLFVLLLGMIARGSVSKEQDDTVDAAYRALVYWDGYWYWNIASEGYHVPETLTPDHFGNVAFFPGYPLTVRLFHSLTGLDGAISLLIVSQFACWPLWTYLLLLLRRYDIPSQTQFLIVGLIQCHPAAYFLVAGYSESLFLASFLGMCYWSARPGWISFVLAAAHGFMMPSTRIVGVPLVVVPLVAVWFTPGSSRSSWLRASALGGLALLGIGCFFGWCHFRFGRWDTYFLVEEAGWGVRPEYWAPLYGRIYWFDPNLLREALNSPQLFNHVMVTVMLVVFDLMALSELARIWRGDSGWRRRIPWYLATFGLIYVPLAGHFNREFGSFTRFSLVAMVPFLILAGDAVRAHWRPWLIPIAVMATAGMAYQVNFAENFLLAHWTF